MEGGESFRGPVGRAGRVPRPGALATLTSSLFEWLTLRVSLGQSNVAQAGYPSPLSETAAAQQSSDARLAVRRRPQRSRRGVPAAASASSR